MRLVRLGMLLLLAPCLGSTTATVQKNGASVKAASVQARHTGTLSATLMSVVRERDRCKGGPPYERYNCESKARTAASLLVRKTGSRRNLDLLEQSLTPAMQYFQNGEASEAASWYSEALFTEFLVERAAILRGLTPAQYRPIKEYLTPDPKEEARLPHMTVHQAVNRLFESKRVRSAFFFYQHDRGEVMRLWHRIDQNDCAAYPVPNCRARLDKALSGFMVQNMYPVQPYNERALSGS